jgi:hypothetical protein
LEVNGQAVTCGGQTTLLGVGPILIESDYHCSGLACVTRFEWEVQGPSGFQDSGSGLPMQFVPGPLGTYMVNVIPLCNGEECPPCQVLIVVKEEPTCACGQWSDLDRDGRPEVRVEGKPVDCGGEITMTTRQIAGVVTIDPTYLCSGERCGAVLYKWSVNGPSGYVRGSGDRFVPGPIEFESSKAGSYVVMITPQCGEASCQASRVTLVVSEEPPLVLTEHRWEFATFDSGGLKITSRNMPKNLQEELNKTGVADAKLVSSTLPMLAKFGLDISAFSGTLTGVIPSNPASYQLAYELYTNSGMAAGVLHVLINVEGGATRCTTPRIELSTGVARWEVLAPDSDRYVPVQATLPNANWVESPDRRAVWVDHDGTSAGRGYTNDPTGTYEYRVSFQIDTDACCGKCPLTFQYAADDTIELFLETPRRTYDLCSLQRGCCGPDDQAYGKLRTCSVNLCDLDAGSGKYTLRAQVENDQTVTGLLIIGSVTCP